uniref:Uncharacterized protein n=1 Tax=Globodera rostochiensis TaxID=31243 RepID=A0A914HEM3_GLORO
MCENDDGIFTYMYGSGLRRTFDFDNFKILHEFSKRRSEFKAGRVTHLISYAWSLRFCYVLPILNICKLMRITSSSNFGTYLLTIMFLLHVAAIKLSKTRFTFLGLLAVLSWPALFFVHYEQINQRDYLISRLALSAFTLLISTAILFLPKKPKRKKRPNTFCSAFSVCSWNTNLTHQRTKNRTEDFEDDVHSLSSKRYMKIGASEQHNGIRSRACLDKTKKERDAFDSMSLRSGKIVERSYAPSLGSFSAHSPAGPSKSFGWPLTIARKMNRTLLRTNTPFKTPGKMMLSERAISPGRKRRQGQQGPFTSLTYNPAVRKIASGFSERSSPFDDGLLGSKAAPASFSRDGSSYSSLSNSNTNSPFRHL